MKLCILIGALQTIRYKILMENMKSTSTLNPAQKRYGDKSTQILPVINSKLLIVNG